MGLVARLIGLSLIFVFLVVSQIRAFKTGSHGYIKIHVGSVTEKIPYWR
jgi:hypothetical protein